jgi:hypothetical protein
LDPPPAGPAPADVHVVADHVGRARRGEVFLVLVGHPVGLNRSAAVRTRIRQRHVHHPVDPVGHRPTRARPVAHPGLATRPLGIWCRHVPRERRGLTLARPLQLLHPSQQPLVLPPQPLVLPGQVRVLRTQHNILAAYLCTLRTQGDVPGLSHVLPADILIIHRWCHSGHSSTQKLDQ